MQASVWRLKEEGTILSSTVQINISVFLGPKDSQWGGVIRY